MFAEVHRVRRIQVEIFEVMRPFMTAKLVVINTAIPKIVIREGKLIEFIYSEAVQKELDYIDRMANEALDYVLRQEGKHL
jgi:hypothetical protein